MIHVDTKDIIINGIFNILKNYHSLIIKKEQRMFIDDIIHKEMLSIIGDESEQKQINKMLSRKNCRLFIAKIAADFAGSSMESASKLLLTAKNNGFKIRNSMGLCAIFMLNNSEQLGSLQGAMSMIYNELHGDANALFVCKQFNTEHQSQAKLILFSLEAE